MAAWSDWNWPEPSAATTASAYVGQPGAFVGWARAARASQHRRHHRHRGRSSRRSIMVASAGILSGPARGPVLASASMRAPLLPSLATASALLLAPPPLAAEGRPLRPDDVFSLKDVADPRLSPDGRWVAYTLTTLDAKEDDSDSDVYLVSTDGGEPLRLTSGKKEDSSPRFSPDGEWIAFLSDREGKKTQVYLMSRKGGEAVKLTDYKASRLGPRLVPRLEAARPRGPRRRPRRAGRGGRGEDRGERRRRRRSRSSCAACSSSATARATSARSGSTSTSSTSRRRRPSRSPRVPSTTPTPPGRPTASRSPSSATAPCPTPTDRRTPTSSWSRRARAASPAPSRRAPARTPPPPSAPTGRWVAYVAGGDPKDLWYGASHVALAPVAGGAVAAAHRRARPQRRRAPASRPTAGPCSSSSRTGATGTSPA